MHLDMNAKRCMIQPNFYYQKKKEKKKKRLSKKVSRVVRYVPLWGRKMSFLFFPFTRIVNLYRPLSICFHLINCFHLEKKNTNLSAKIDKNILKMRNDSSV